MEKIKPILFNRLEECCGCTACYAICPREAISMVEDEEGFEYPQIDEGKCIKCYQCIEVCPIKAHSKSWGQALSGLSPKLCNAQASAKGSEERRRAENLIAALFTS